MHTYDAPWPLDRIGASVDPLPSFEDFRFNDATDVEAWATLDFGIGARTNPDVWHLDDEGALQCGYRTSSFDSIARWAEDPSDLLRSRRVGLAEGGCGDRWLIIESRSRFWHGDGPKVDEGDVRAFHKVRAALAKVGVTLVDVMIFDDERHWWSMQELTTGSTAWPPPAGGNALAPIANLLY